MPDLQTNLSDLTRYLHDILQVKIDASPWRAAERLPRLLRDLYRFAEMRLLGTPVLLMLDSQPDEPPPAVVRKHMNLVRDKSAMETVYVRSQVTAYNRKRLVDHKIPFIVPGNQMYLPMLGLDFREHFRRTRSQRTRFSPATQVVVIYALLRPTEQVLFPGELAKRLGYSPMTMTRAFDELEAAELGEVFDSGRERCLRIVGPKREVWNKAEPLLRSPVIKRIAINHAPVSASSALAGLSALSQYSMLAPPDCPIYAIGRDDWVRLRRQLGLATLPTRDPDAHPLEVWSYPPALLARGRTADPLSLFLSLKDTRDERVEAALGEMMRHIQW